MLRYIDSTCLALAEAIRDNLRVNARSSSNNTKRRLRLFRNPCARLSAELFFERERCSSPVSKLVSRQREQVVSPHAVRESSNIRRRSLHYLHRDVGLTLCNSRVSIFVEPFDHFGSRRLPGRSGRAIFPLDFRYVFILSATNDVAGGDIKWLSPPTNICSNLYVPRQFCNEKYQSIMID